MSDDISIPRTMSRLGQEQPRASFTHSYRTRRSSGMDSGTKHLTIAAGGLGLLLALGMGAWSTMGHTVRGVPVIEADSRPLRVKPDNPGGMTVVGANEQIMSSGDGDGGGDMAPPPEQPDPQALRAQMQLSAATPAPAPTQAPDPAVTQPAPPPATPVSAPGKDIAAPVEAAVVLPAPVPAARPAPPPLPPLASGTMVQIAAVDSEAAANTEWTRLQHKMPDVLGDRRPVIQHAEHDGKAIWRIRTGGFADIADATAFCAKVRAKGAGCSLASF